MEWLSQLTGKTIGLDTAPLIYFIEEAPIFLSVVQPFFRAMENGDFQVTTSTITLAEVLVQPLKRGRLDLARQYKELLLSAPNLEILPVSAQIAERAAGLRAMHNLSTPDAMQLATALVRGAEFFLTNDAALARASQPKILLLSELSARPL